MNHLYNYETPVLGRLMDERFRHDSQIDINVPRKPPLTKKPRKREALVFNQGLQPPYFTSISSFG